MALNGGSKGDGDYIFVWNHVLLPLAYEFAPDLVLISAGFDAAHGDPLGGYKVTPPGYSHLTHLLKPLANGRMVVALEGGYNLDSISASMAAVTRVLVGDDVRRRVVVLSVAVTRPLTMPARLCALRPCRVAAHAPGPACVRRPSHAGCRCHHIACPRAALVRARQAGRSAGYCAQRERQFRLG